MKFQINIETIKTYLRRLSTSVHSVASRVELTGVLISVYDNSIVFEGRNDYMDTKIEEGSLDKIKIIESGRALLKAQTLNEIVQKMEGQYVTFTKIDSNVMTIEDVDSKYQINLLSDENYEKTKFVSQDDISQVVSMPAKLFRKAVNKTAFAGSDIHSKFIFQGLNLSIEQNRLTTSATDGIKIASWNGPIESTERLDKIIPLKVVRELVKILPESGNYKFQFTNNKCLLVSENMINQFSLIEGTFPRFNKMFNPEIYNKKLAIEKDVILNAIDRATILANTSAQGAKIKLTISTESFAIESSAEIGSTKIEVRGHNYKGENITMAISPKILQDGVKHCETEKIEIQFVDSSSPALLKCENDEFTYVMSPMI